MSDYLSKFEFQLAQSCPTKLYYKKWRYPSTMDEDKMLRFLIEDNKMVHAIGKVLFPEGRQVGSGRGLEAAVEETRAALKAEEVVLFGAKFVSNRKRCTVDILLKRGNRFELIDARAKVYDSAKNEQRMQKGVNLFRSLKEGHPILSGWQKEIEEVAFQVGILEELFPEAEVEPFLLLPDSAKTSTRELVHSNFVRHVEASSSRFERVRFEFVGDGEEVRQKHILSKINVASEVRQVMDRVKEKANEYVSWLHPRLQKISTPIGHHCKSCEYRVESDHARDGFRECWGAFAEVTPHLFDMYRIQATFADSLIEQGRVGLLDIKEQELVTVRGKIGKDHKRQRIQLQHMLSNTEWISDDLPDILRTFRYPLHFLDFEVSGLVLPYHANMYPYDPVAFQWSCHTLHTPDGELEHAEWINTEDKFPNYRFAETLMEHIGATGTIFAWGNYENYLLGHLLEQSEHHHYDNLEVKEWLEEVIKQDKKDTGRIVDMNRLTQKHYFHPLMKGRTSLKKVLNAIWQSNPALRARCPEYVKEEDGELVAPYDALPPLIIDGQKLVVNQGAGPVRAYQAMLYGAGRYNPQVRQQWKQLLLQYCKLDTLAMVMLWWHWWERIANSADESE